MPATTTAAAEAKPKATPKPKPAAAAKGRAKYEDPEFPGLRKGDRQRYGAGLKYMAVACPKCGAKAKKPCTEKAGLRAPHAGRIKAVDAK